jgi:cytoskeleton protein RodZ
MVLKTAREAQGMSVADAASRLRMSTKQIDSLEASEWSKLPGDAFARGALRSYGKLLGVDVTSMLDAIGGFAQAADVRPSASLATRMPRQGAYGFDSSGRNSWIAWGVLAALAVVAVGFFYGGDKIAPTTKSSNLSATKAVVTSPVPAAPVVQAEAPATLALPSPVGSAVAPASEAAPTSSAVALATAVSAANSAADRLELLSDKSAWVEVKNAESKVLFSGYLVANTPKILEDVKPPLRLVVGSARSVKVSWRGQAVDVLSKARDDVARFSIE